MKQFLTSYNRSITILLLLAVLMNIVVMRIFDAPLKNELAKHGIVSFELAKDLHETTKILDSWDVHAKNSAALSLGFDFLFLLAYSSFIALLIFNINNRLWKNSSYYKIGRFLIIMVFIAAFFDIVENIALIKLLLGDLRQIWSSVAYFFASAKFGIITICILYVLCNGLFLLFKRGNKLIAR